MYILYHKTKNQLVPSKWNDTCRTYVTEFTQDLSDWIAYHTPLISWFWVFSGLCASNVCTPFRHSYAFYAKIYNICSSDYCMKKMLLCGFHWHSRYSIWISTFVLMHTVLAQGVPLALKCIS